MKEIHPKIRIGLQKRNVKNQTLSVQYISNHKDEQERKTQRGSVWGYKPVAPALRETHTMLQVNKKKEEKHKDSLKLLEENQPDDMSTSLLISCHHECRWTWFSN